MFVRGGGGKRERARKSGRDRYREKDGEKVREKFMQIKELQHKNIPAVCTAMYVPVIDDKCSSRNSYSEVSSLHSVSVFLLPCTREEKNKKVDSMNGVRTI